MTEAQWLKSNRVDAMADIRLLRLSRRTATLVGVASVRATTGAAGQRLLMEAAAAAEEAADTGQWKEVNGLHRRAGAACQGLTLSSVPHDWAQAARFLTSPSVETVWTTVAYLLLQATPVPSKGTRGIQRAYANILRDVAGNPFRGGRLGSVLRPEWRTDTAVSLAKEMYEGRDFAAMPILADALQDAGCDDEPVLAHCRGPRPHVRGCWVVDLVLGKA